MGLLDRIVKAKSSVTGQIMSVRKGMTRKVNGTNSDDEDITEFDEIYEDPSLEGFDNSELQDIILDLAEYGQTEEPSEDVPGSEPSGESVRRLSHEYREPEIKGMPTNGGTDGLYSLNANFITNNQRRHSWEDL